jgi:hypothetical protein
LNFNNTHTCTIIYPLYIYIYIYIISTIYDAQAQWRTTSAALPKKTGVEGLCALAPPLCQERWEKWETGDGARGPAKVEHVFRGWKKPIKKYRNTSRSHIYIYIHSYIYISPVIIGHHGNILENPLGMEVDSWANYDEIIHIQWGYNRM